MRLRFFSFAPPMTRVVVLTCVAPAFAIPTALTNASVRLYVYDNYIFSFLRFV